MLISFFILWYIPSITQYTPKTTDVLASVVLFSQNKIRAKLNKICYNNTVTKNYGGYYELFTGIIAGI